MISLSTGIDTLSTSTSTAVGSLSTGVSSLSVALSNTVQYDTPDHTSVTFGTLGTPVTLDNVAPGAVNENSLQAVNGSQLFATAQSVADALGGGASVDSDGKVTPPTYTFTDKDNSTFDNVGDALTNLDGRVTQNTNDITTINTSLSTIYNTGIKYFHANSTLADSSPTGAESVAIGGAAVASADNSVALGSNSVADQANTVSVGAPDAERRITNVAAGIDSTDAVNVSQLTSTISTSLANTVTYDDPSRTRITLHAEDPAAQVTIDNVANGKVDATSHEAINGSQLFATAQSTADALGGGASVDADGKIVKPSYTFTDKDNSTFDNVGDALTNLDGRVTQNTNDITTINTSLSTIYNTGIKYFHANSTLADSSPTGAESVAIGGAAVASADNSVALGSNSVADQANTVSVGAPDAERRITNVAAGIDSTDAVNVSQLTSTISTSLANTVTYDDPSRTRITLHAEDPAAQVTIDNVANGKVDATSHEAINGSQLFATAQSTADALGGGASVDADGKVTPPTYTFKDNSTYNTVGGALTNLDDRVTQNTANIATINNTLNNINEGGGITYFHANSTLNDSSATGTESVAIGGNAQAAANNAVALGSNSVADRDNSVSVGAKGAERQITNVAAGTADTDAVNVSQLKQAGLINGDGSSKTAVTYDTKADGTTDYSSLTLGDGTVNTTIHNVGEGVAGTDAVNVNQMNAAIDRVTNIAETGGNPMFAAQGNRDTEAASATGAHATAMGANASATADNSVALGANSVADRVNTVSVGSAGNERQITNVADGTQATDAVNVRQLNLAAAQSQSYTDSRIAGVQSQINDVSKTAYGGIAAAMAAAGLPQPTTPGKTMVAIAGARYAGASGAAIGISYVTQDDKWVVKASGNTSSSGNVGFTIGAGHQW
ncbi:YadA family autotransporter adhesin [Caballeronia calidae]|uniref:YadA family autotransporter adhesin n=1 Tax=Caballeronia calidae TaxID=1777139 RepID=UPI00078748CB|nr:YadA family autotransporter adhesin [Caballeronia calidae]